jgi:biotin carboxyl carrier protein
LALIKVLSEIAGNVWMVEVEPGAQVAEDDTLVILESMKMEIPVDAPGPGKVIEIRVAKDDVVAEGDLIAIIES